MSDFVSLITHLNRISNSFTVRQHLQTTASIT